MSRELLIAVTPDEAVFMKTGCSSYLAGGTEVLREGSSVRADRLIMLKNVDALKGITETDEGTVRIGSMTTFEEGVQSPLVPDYFRNALCYMASRTKREMATIGGNIALLRDDSYLAAVLFAAHARLEILTGEGSVDRVCIRKYSKSRSMYQDALILAVHLKRDAKVVSKRYANTAESHSYLTAAMGIADGKHRVGITVKNSGVFFPKEDFEKLDEGSMSDEEYMDWAKSFPGLAIPDDIYGSSAYKRYLLGVTLPDLARELEGKEGTLS